MGWGVDGFVEVQLSVWGRGVIVWDVRSWMEEQWRSV